MASMVEIRKGGRSGLIVLLFMTNPPPLPPSPIPNNLPLKFKLTTLDWQAFQS